MDKYIVLSILESFGDDLNMEICIEQGWAKFGGYKSFKGFPKYSFPYKIFKS